MDAKELRIGNMLCITSLAFDIPLLLEVVELKYKYARVKYQYEGKEKTSLVEYSELGCVVLTEEWLLKFGFIKRNEYEFDFWQNSMWKLKEYKNKKYYILFHCSDEVDCTMIKYVHQLQNLYFALTGEELKEKGSV